MKVDDSQQIHSIVNMRAAAAVGVMLFHFVGNTGFLEMLPGLKAASRYGELGVCLFFVISGFIIPYAMHRRGYRLVEYGRFVVRRLARLEPPYLVNLVFVLLAGYGLHKVTGAPFNITAGQALLHLGYLNAWVGQPWISVVYWTLSVEFQYYLCAGLLYPLLVGGPWMRRGALAGLLLVSLPAQALPRDFFFCHTPLFVLGMISFLWRSQKIGQVEAALAAGLALAVSAYTQGPAVALAGGFAVLLLFGFSYRNAILAFLGQISYSLYLMHPLLGSVVISAVKRRTQDLWPQLAGLGLAIALTLAGSWLLYLVAERPAMRLAARLK